MVSGLLLGPGHEKGGGMLVSDAGGGAPPVKLAEIAVSIEAIEDLADFLNQQLTQNIAPVTTEVIRGHHNGDALLGPDRSLVYLLVKSQYEHATAADIETLKSYVDATVTMALAMRTLAGVYRDADSMANATLGEVIAAFDESWADIQSVEQTKLLKAKSLRRVLAGEPSDAGGGFVG
jgi:hypothetical protein